MFLKNLITNLNISLCENPYYYPLSKRISKYQNYLKSKNSFSICFCKYHAIFEQRIYVSAKVIHQAKMQKWGWAEMSRAIAQYSRITNKTNWSYLYSRAEIFAIASQACRTKSIYYFASYYQRSYLPIDKSLCNITAIRKRLRNATIFQCDIFSRPNGNFCLILIGVQDGRICACSDDFLHKILYNFF